MTRHNKTTKGLMGIAVLSVLGIFWGLHAAFPEVKLWPLGTVTLVIVTMAVGHFKKSSRDPERRGAAESES
ncbi:MAG: hypothetical protein OEV49_11450 [candidate division Zixibacteria bacterium]|nr:hypothetical protein [candidate division Zixibacteria bacterium]MDH3938099.1 hypothetical protein [candidate division Zixibacteria bacterium]MDH4032968.1 hypothetical protein [candidate division Zixibacteria bacterium]